MADDTNCSKLNCLCDAIRRLEPCAGHVLEIVMMTGAPELYDRMR